jgi:tetratricopeptide (TPR) repeat protein
MHHAVRIGAKFVLGALVPALFAWQDADALYRSGLRLFAEKQPEAAIAALRQSVAIQPANGAAWKALGVVYASRGDYETAEAPFRNACERQPALEDACLYYGRALYLLDRFLPAVDVLRRAISLRDNAEAHRLLALSLEALGQGVEAGDEFRAAIRLSRDTRPDEDPGIDYGVYLFRGGNAEQSIAPLDAALKRHPNSARGHLELGCVLLALDRLSEAADHLERSVAINPGASRAHLLLGKTYLRLAKTEAAEAQFKQVR